MREDYEEKSFNPVKLGIIGAVIVAIAVFLMIQFQASSEARLAAEQQQIETQQELNRTKGEAKALKEKLAQLEEEATTAKLSLQKQLRVKETQIANVSNEKVAYAKDAQQKLSELKKIAETKVAEWQKHSEQLEKEIAQLKKTNEQQSQINRQLAEKFDKAQKDLQQFQTRAAKQEKGMRELQERLDRITEGDRAAADAMVEQLAQARQELRRERELRQQLEEELELLRQE